MSSSQTSVDDPSRRPMAVLDLDISKPVTLPCGLGLPNRLAKAAMAEGWGTHEKLPHGDLVKTYRLWAEGQWGMIITGNVQVDAAYLGTPEDIALNESLGRQKHIQSMSEWAAEISKKGTPAILQINHPGRQTTIGAGTRSYFAKSIAPSAIGVNLGPGLIAKAASALVFGTPRQMSDLEIEDVVRRFATTAQIAHQSGFAGVEIHAAHGYLLASFLSSKSNTRSDKYGGSATNRCRIVVDIIHAVRAVVPKEFCVGIKFNSVDHQKPGEFDDCIAQLAEIVNVGVDFLEISGGSYEDPQMMASTSSTTPPKVTASTAAREAFFIEFANAVRKSFPNVFLMVTGGFRSRAGLEQAVKSGACDLVGVGRPSVVEPHLPKRIVFNAKVADEDARLKTKSFTQSTLARGLGVKAIGGGTETLGYTAEIHRMLRNTRA